MAHVDPGIRIQYAAIPVDDQANAELFYIEKLGFHIIDDVPVGEHRWLTVSSNNGMEGVELLLEPNVLPATRGRSQGPGRHLHHGANGIGQRHHRTLRRHLWEPHPTDATYLIPTPGPFAIDLGRILP